MAKNKLMVPLTIEDVTNYRKQIEVLESLIIQRDEINERIAKIDKVLYGSLKDLDLLDHLGTKPNKERKERVQNRSKESVASRIIQACKGGATKLEVIKALGLSPKTAEAYLYSSKIGGKLLTKTVNDEGVAIWFPKE
jgi:hypothetical protein